MNKFKVGDKVKIVDRESHKGKEGRIESIYEIDSKDAWNIRFDDNTVECFFEWHLRLVKRGKQKKLTHLIIYDLQDRDPVIECYGIKQVIEEVERLHKDEKVIKESIKIYEIKSIIEPIIKVGLKKVS